MKHYYHMNYIINQNRLTIINLVSKKHVVVNKFDNYIHIDK